MERPMNNIDKAIKRIERYYPTKTIHVGYPVDVSTHQFFYGVDMDLIKEALIQAKQDREDALKFLQKEVKTMSQYLIPETMTALNNLIKQLSK